jgi:hypothetical protein
MELDETDMSRISEEEVCVGRWSHYRVPERIEERLSLTKKPRKTVHRGQDCRGQDYRGEDYRGEDYRCST